MGPIHWVRDDLSFPTSHPRRSHIPKLIVTILYHNKKDAHQGVALYIINSEGIAYHPQLVAVYHQAADEYARCRVMRYKGAKRP